jgi:hypothetical protein
MATKKEIFAYVKAVEKWAKEVRKAYTKLKPGTVTTFDAPPPPTPPPGLETPPPPPNP